MMVAPIMANRRYCCDCSNYIPGGVHPNCVINKAKNNKYKSTCPIAFACAEFKAKNYG